MRPLLLTFFIISSITILKAQDCLILKIRRGDFSEIINEIRNNKYSKDDLGYALVVNLSYSKDSSDSIREKIANFLIDNGADVNEETAIGSPLILSTKINYEKLAIKLINLGADVNAIKEREQTALMFACANGNYKLVNILISKGADVNAKGRIYAADTTFITPLKIAKGNNFKEIINLLIKSGAVD